MHSASDIYLSEVGDILQIPADSTTPHEIYGELLINKKLGIVDIHPGLTESHYVVKIAPSLSATDFAKLLVMSEFCGEEKLYVEIPSGINPETLRACVYVLMRETHVYYTIRIADGVIKATRKANKKNDEGIHVKSLIKHLLSTKTGEIRDIQKPRNMKLAAFTQSIRREAQNQNVKIKMRNEPSGITLSIDDGKEIRLNDNFKYRFEQWLDSINYDVETLLVPPFDNPDRRKYMTLCAHLSKHDCAVIPRADYVIKYSARIKYHKGKYTLMVRGKAVAEMNEIDNKKINLLLVPYGLTTKDLQS